MLPSLAWDAILFDNDGVLVDTEGLYFRANREVLAGIGVPLDETAYVELFLRTGRGAWHLAEALGCDGEAVAAMRAARDARYLQLLEESELLILGAGEAVRALRTRYRLAIVTSSEPEPFARAHRRTGLLPAFELALTREQYGESKPHPEPYLRAVERLGADPRRCLVIEDSERGLRAAKAAGLACWVIPSALTRGGRFEAADAVLADLSDATRRLMGEA